jgi:hypothetical protein
MLPMRPSGRQSALYSPAARFRLTLAPLPIPSRVLDCARFTPELHALLVLQNCSPGYTHPYGNDA